MRKIHSIVIHHSAGSRKMDVATLDRMHRARGFNEIGYHAVITQAGGEWHLEPGRDIDKIGAHAGGRGDFPGNYGSIGICIAGNYVDFMPTYEPINILYKQCREWFEEFGQLGIWGHCDLNATKCPGQLYYAIPPLRVDLSDPKEPTDLRDRFYIVRDWAEDEKAAKEFFRQNRPGVA